MFPGEGLGCCGIKCSFVFQVALGQDSRVRVWGVGGLSLVQGLGFRASCFRWR